MSGADSRKAALFFFFVNITAILIAKDHKAEPKISLMQDISCFHVTFPGKKVKEMRLDCKYELH